jgi:thiol:disulfide interchange protein DsbD
MKGVNAIVSLGALLVIIALLAWIKGSFWTPISSNRSRVLAAVAMLAVLGFATVTYRFVTKPSQLIWQQFSQDSFEKVIASGRPVFIDFTADWCITCKSNERFVIDTPRVRQEFTKRNVVVLKADWTNGDPVITEILKQHGRVGVPMYLVYPGGSKDRKPVLLPELLTTQFIIDALNKA